MSAGPGWYLDSDQRMRYWNGISWGRNSSTGNSGANDVRYRIYGQPGANLGHSSFGDAAAAGQAGEIRTAQVLERLLNHYPHARLFHSVRLDSAQWDIDHVLVLGRLVFFIDAKNWRGRHDYLLQFDSYFDLPSGWTGDPHDPRFLRDRVLRWNRESGSDWETFSGSVIRLRGMSQRFAQLTGISDAAHYRFIPVLVAARDDVSTRIDADQPTWMQFSNLTDLEARIAEVVQAEERYADGEDAELLAQFTRLQANAQIPAVSSTAVVHEAPQFSSAPQPIATSAVYPAPANRAEGNGLAVAGFVVGLVSVFLPLFFGMAAAITGLGLSIGGMNRAGVVGEKKGLAVAGLVLSIVGLILIL